MGVFFFLPLLLYPQNRISLKRTAATKKNRTCICVFCVGAWKYASASVVSAVRRNKKKKERKKKEPGTVLTTPAPSSLEVIQDCAPTGDVHVQMWRSVPALGLIITQSRRYLWHRFFLCVCACFFVCFMCRAERRAQHVQSRLFSFVRQA